MKVLNCDEMFKSMNSQCLNEGSSWFDRIFTIDEVEVFISRETTSVYDHSLYIRNKFLQTFIRPFVE